MKRTHKLGWIQWTSIWLVGVSGWAEVARGQDLQPITPSASSSYQAWSQAHRPPSPVTALAVHLSPDSIKATEADWGHPRLNEWANTLQQLPLQVDQKGLAIKGIPVWVEPSGISVDLYQYRANF
ncbi:MAG: hypothetical protein NW237_11875 [Cyanobacteriota bacterium]|nr:hypothetical protein [Cyanobacteriota bacterium]